MIDGTREGEMDAAYMLRVEEAEIVVECMCRGDRDLKVGFIDQNPSAAVPWHWDGWGRCRWRLFNKLCVGVGSQRISDQLGGVVSSHHLFHHHGPPHWGAHPFNMAVCTQSVVMY